MSDEFTYTAGRLPLVVSIPHDGREIPDEIAARMTDTGRANVDADWHVTRLYDFAADVGAHVLSARLSRYVIDLNRDPEDTALYAGAVNTGLVPELAFDGTPLYREGEAPGSDEIAIRTSCYWQPYHDRLRALLQDIREEQGGVVLFDAHSIKSEVPRLFEGPLPDLNLGTNNGRSADPELEARAFAVLDSADQYSSVLNGRFKGGYITRAYGRPSDNMHALQLELGQRTHLRDDPPFTYDQDGAAELQVVLRNLLEALCDWARERFR